MEMESLVAPEPPSWAYMLPDALASIFMKLSLEEILTVIPTVCRTWMRVSQDAICWQKVDLEDWSPFRDSLTVERMIELLVSRSRGCLREFSVYGLESEATLHFIASSGSHLQVLRITGSRVSNDCICEVASKLPSITYLDISDCSRLSNVAVEAVGKKCRLITRLCLNMLHPATDDVAFAVARYMPQLKHLEMAGNRLLSNSGLKAVLDKCTNLEYLDVRGCWGVNMEDGFLEESRKRLKVFHVPNSDAFDLGADSGASDSDSNSYLDPMDDYYYSDFDTWDPEMDFDSSESGDEDYVFGFP